MESQENRLLGQRCLQVFGKEKFSWIRPTFTLRRSWKRPKGMTQINSGMGRYIRIFVLVDLQFWKRLSSELKCISNLLPTTLSSEPLFSFFILSCSPFSNIGSLELNLSLFLLFKRLKEKRILKLILY